MHDCIEAFDLFTGLWWPLRRGPRVPGREASWLVAKLFPWNPSTVEGGSLGDVLGQTAPRRREDLLRERRRIDSLLRAQGRPLEACLRQAVCRLNRAGVALDWVQVLQDLTLWDRPWKPTQTKWARDWLQAMKGTRHAR